MPAAIIASESAFSLSGRLRVSVASRSVSSKRRSSVSVAIARLLPGRHARRRGTIAWPCPLGYEGDNGGHPPRRRGRRRRDARDLRALRARDRNLLRARAAVGGGVPAPRPERARGGALAPVRGGRQRPGLRLCRALPRAPRLSVDGRGDGVCAGGPPPQGRRPRPLHLAARLPRAAGLPERGRYHRAPQPGERRAPRAHGVRAGRGAAHGRLQARALARRRLVAARARRARDVARAAAPAGGAAGESRVAARPRCRPRARARLGSSRVPAPVGAACLPRGRCHGGGAELGCAREGALCRMRMHQVSCYGVYMAAQTTTMTVRVPVQVKRRLERLAKATERTASWLAADALAAYVDLHDWQVAAIGEGIADAEAGRVVEDERVATWLASWGTRRKRRAP